jgi:NAD(P) transhydrogenase
MIIRARYDVLVIGSGPAGQKAAIQAAKADRAVAVIEQDAAPGGACVRHGTIPSKTLRETTMVLASLRRRSGNVIDVPLPETLKVASLMTRLDDVTRGHQRYIRDQLRRNGVDVIHGRARFVSPTELDVTAIDGRRTRVAAGTIVIATGSRPRTPPEIPVDHETILDSDSILSMLYLPRSITVLGAGVVASEYASIFAALGVSVTMIDKGPRPLAFLDSDLGDRFVHMFEETGGRFIGGTTIRSVRVDELAVHTELASGEIVSSDKMLCALGRVAALDRLDIGAAGLEASARGLLSVDGHCRTTVPTIYAVGDVIGPPALAASAMEQGRRAVCHALGLDPGAPPEFTPIGIYTIPEMASVGLTEEQVRAQHGRALVGRARFDEIARGHIVTGEDGFLKMVADEHGERLLGVQIIGDGATELIHLGQMALISASPVETFVENIFNFPTLAEAYRVAALDIIGQRAAARRSPGSRPQPAAGPAPA